MINNKLKKTYTINELKGAFLFLLPLILFLLLFILIPIVGTFITSGFRDVSFLEKKFIFFDNYKTLFSDSVFWHDFGFTVVFVIVSVSLEMLLGISFALLLNQYLPFRGLLRAVVLIPWAIPVAISARIWELIYNYHYGLANYLIMQLGISKEPINWLGTNIGAFFALVLSDAWKTTPFVTIILLTGLQAIPKEIHNQAKVDRAHFFQRFYKITLPLLKPVIVVALLFRTIDGLRIFDLIYVLTHGGPGGSTSSISLYGYKYFLSGDFGYGSAISVSLFIVAFALSLLYIKIGRFGKEIL
ncbi:MAG: ABC transporter permease [Elusimicrobia bacterium CG1_02_37_114]|nr:MAG: ABC transporter permease [Elusimicrobia bacterium CG1_02_37_114]